MTLNLASIVRHSAQRQPARTAITLGDQRLSYADLHDLVQRMAGALLARGIRPTQHVGLLLPNVPEFSVAYFGCLYAGCPVVPLNVMLTPEEIAYQLRDSDAVALIAWERFAPAAQEAVSRVDGCTHLVVAPTELRSMLELAEPVRDLAPTRADDTAVILYTSGTTGRPKGAELTHCNLYLNTHTASAHVLRLGPDTVTLAALPMSHVMGQITVQAAVLDAGGEVVMLPRFEPRTALEAMQRHRVSYFVGVPTMYGALLALPDAADYDLSALKLCASGGSSLPLDLVHAFRERFGLDIFEGYGLSETSPLVTFDFPSLPRKPGSIGIPLPGVEVRLVSSDGNVVTTPGEPGEICVKGPSVMKGYYKRPEDTRAAIDNGWFRTGDVGAIDEDGRYRIVDRLKDMIVRGGLKVYPREVEEVLYAHPAVAEAAVIGIPDPAQGEEVKAVIALKQGATATEQDIISYCREHLALYKYPRVVELRESLPKGPTGKIMKKALKPQGSLS